MLDTMSETDLKIMSATAKGIEEASGCSLLAAFSVRSTQYLPKKEDEAEVGA